MVNLVLTGSLTSIFSEEALKKASLNMVFRMHSKKRFNPAVYKDTIITELRMYGEDDLACVVESWFTDPKFGKTKNNWKRLLNLKVKDDRLKRELHRIYDTIISDLNRSRVLLFFKVPVKFDSDNIDTYKFLVHYNNNSCIRYRKFYLDNVYPVLITNENGEIKGRALCFEKTLNDRIYHIIFNVYIQDRLSYSGFYDLLKDYLFDLDDYQVLKERNYRGWVGAMYIDDYIVVSSDNNDDNVESIIKEFFDELYDNVIDNVIGECYNCGAVVRDDDDYVYTVEDHLYCMHCSDNLIWCDRCDGYHDPEVIEVVRVDLGSNVYHSCDFEILR